MANLSLALIWNDPIIKDTRIYDHRHHFYELVYYRQGEGTTRINGKGYSFTENTFAVIHPYEEHSEIHEKDGEVYCLGFYCDRPMPTSVNFDNSGKILMILKQILKESTQQLYGYEDVITAKLNELYVEIQRTKQTKEPVAKNFEFTINYLSENFHKKIVLSDLAKHLNFSYDYFQHKFKKITGVSPQKFLLNKRLSAAREMLCSSKLTCTEIAYRCGFSTSAQFSMLFKNEFGITPKQYRKEQSLRFNNAHK